MKTAVNPENPMMNFNSNLRISLLFYTEKLNHEHNVSCNASTYCRARRELPRLGPAALNKQVSVSEFLFHASFVIVRISFCSS